MFDIKVYHSFKDVADPYTIQIGEHTWTASSDAHMPNGVCMYSGRRKIKGEFPVNMQDIPDGIKKQIYNMIKTYTLEQLYGR